MKLRNCLFIIGALLTTLWTAPFSSAQAPGTVITPNGKGDRPIGAPAPSGAANTNNGITYHGGPIMLGTVNIYYIWYGNWSGANGTAAINILTNLAQNIGGSPYFNINTTYYNGAGQYVSNSILYAKSTTDSYSQGTSLSDNSVQAIVSSAITSGALPNDPFGVYFVLASADVNETSGFCTQYCGWHSSAPIGGNIIKYAFIGDADRCPSACAEQSPGPNGTTGPDGMASIITHELEESVTDPDLDAWYDSAGNENADKCAWTFGTTYKAPNGAKANMSLGGLNYLIQQDWVNASGGYCALSYSTTADFSLSPSPASNSAAPGGAAAYTLTVHAVNGFAGPVNLTVAGLPSGAMGTFTPNPATTSSTLNVTTASTTPTGTYTLTITGTSGLLTHTTTTTLVVALPDFSVSSTPSSQTAAAGGSASYSVAVSALNGFTGNVVFSVSGLPGGVTPGFSPATVVNSGSTTMTLTVGSGTAAGTYPLTITATSGSLNHTANVTLYVTTGSGSGTQILLLHGNASEVSGVQNAAIVTPAVGPAGFTGTVVNTGGSVNFAASGDGVWFLNCCKNTSNAYYHFTGTGVGSVFGASQGQISFNLTSRYSFAQRKSTASAQRYAFDVRDGTGKHLFSFVTQVTSPYLTFTWQAAGSSNTYFVPAGTEDALFGVGVQLQITIVWSGTGSQLYLNGNKVSTLTANGAGSWTAASVFDLGAYEYLTFGGYDSSDDAISEFTVTMSGGPTVSLTAPANLATVSGTIAVSANATASAGVAKVQFQLDGANLGSVVTAAPYTVSWNTTTASNTSHALTAVVTDGVGNTATSATVTVTVSNVPTVTLTAPANLATVSGTIAVSANATAAAGVAKVQFQLDGANLGSALTATPYTVNWNTTSVMNGSHSLTAVVTDSVGNTATSATVTVTVSNVPTVTLTAPANLATVSGAIAVSANATAAAGVAKVQFQLDGASLGSPVTSAPYSVNWNTTTATNTSHTLAAIVTDAVGNTATSATITVTVSNVPTVTLTAPANLATVSGTIAVSANATAAAGVAKVQFQLDGASFGSPVTSAPYSVNWNTTTATNTSHTLAAIVTDAVGNTATSATVTVTVSNVPTVTLTAPANLAPVSGTIAVSANATAAAGVAKVQFQLDGASLGSPVTSAPYSVNWNTTIATNTSHTLGAIVTDAVGNTATSATITVTVNNVAPPTVTLTSPANLATVSGTVAVSANATAGAGVAKVQFQVDGGNLGNPVTAAPYTMNWNTTTASNTSHALTAVVTDAVGNTATSATITVTVNNTVAGPALILHGNASEVSGAQNGAIVTPSVGPAGFTGTVVNTGGSVNFAAGGDGVWFLNCCKNTSNAYYHFTGTGVGSVFGASQGQISFNLTSHYSFAQRKSTAAAQRYAFDVRDGTGKHLFSFLTQITAPYLTFAWQAAGSSNTYFVPAGTEDALFGAGVQMQVAIVWTGTGAQLYLNGNKVQSVAGNTVGNWTAASTFDFGAFEYLTYGGYDSSDDAISEFTVGAPAPIVTLTAPAYGATVIGTVSVTALATAVVGVSSVQFQLDGANLGNPVTAAPYTTSWNTTSTTDGTHAITAIVTDKAGNTAVSTVVPVVVGN